MKKIFLITGLSLLFSGAFAQEGVRTSTVKSDGKKKEVQNINTNKAAVADSTAVRKEAIRDPKVINPRVNPGK